jgi:hypothetical protein
MPAMLPLQLVARGRGGRAAVTGPVIQYTLSRGGGAVVVAATIVSVPEASVARGGLERLDPALLVTVYRRWVGTPQRAASNHPKRAQAQCVRARDRRCSRAARKAAHRAYPACSRRRRGGVPWRAQRRVFALKTWHRIERVTPADAPSRRPAPRRRASHVLCTSDASSGARKCSPHCPIDLLSIARPAPIVPGRVGMLTTRSTAVHGAGAHRSALGDRCQHGHEVLKTSASLSGAGTKLPRRMQAEDAAARLSTQAVRPSWPAAGQKTCSESRFHLSRGRWRQKFPLWNVLLTSRA